MQKNRLEAFSDGVIAIIITIMVLELKVPDTAEWGSLIKLAPKFISYVISFIYVGIYWNNHHHLIHTVTKIKGSLLWANTHLLFWLSLIPFVTAWAGEHNFAQLPVAAYSFVMFMAGVSYYILSKTIIASHGKDSILYSAIGKDFKGQISVIAYAISIPMSFYFTWVSLLLIALIAVLWLIPDKRIEKTLKERE